MTKETFLEDYPHIYHGSARLTRARGGEESTVPPTSHPDAEIASTPVLPSTTVEEIATLLATLATIIGPPSTARSACQSIRTILEALIRARDRAVPAGTSARDAHLAHGRLVALLHRVRQMQNGGAK